MPVVPTYGRPKVATAALPGVRLNPNAPESAFQPPKPVDFSGLTEVAARVHEEETQKADQIAVLSADNALSDLQRSVLNGPDGVLNRQGMDAVEASSKVPDVWKKRVSEIESGLTSDAQKLAFARASSFRWNRVNEEMETHVDAETRKYDTSQTQLALDNAKDDAIKNYADPSKIKDAIDTQVATIKDFAARHRSPDSFVQDAVSKNLSELHEGVIDRMLANGQDLAASSYYSEYQQQINGKTATQVESKLELGSVRGESQRQADAIVDSSISLAQAMGKARTIKEPRVRELTEQRIRQAFSDRATETRRDQAEAFDQAADIVERTHSTHKVPVGMWLALSPTQKTSLEHRVKQLSDPEGGGSGKVKTDYNVYMSLLNMSSLSDRSRQEFDGLNLLQWKNKLSDTDFKHLLSIQAGNRTRTQTAISGEAKRQATASGRQSGANADAMEYLKTLNPNYKPTATPGSPIARPSTPTPSATTNGIPQAWIDHARRDPNYKLYLEHMGIKVPQ